MSCEYKKVSLKVLILVFTILLQTTLFAKNQNQNRINEILAVSVSDTAGDPVRICKDENGIESLKQKLFAE